LTVVSYLKLEFKFQITTFFDYVYRIHVSNFTLNILLQNHRKQFLLYWSIIFHNLVIRPLI